MLDFDYMLEPEEKDDRVGTCCTCGEELYCADEVLKYNGELYCDYDCLKAEIGTYETETYEDTSCSFCSEPLYKGEDVIEDTDGSVYCDKGCVFSDYQIKEVCGYDL